MTVLRRAAWLFGLAALLGGCAGSPHGKPTRTSAGQARAARDRHQPAPLPAHTGIAACDDYLSSYRACHRAAGIFAPGQIEPRYQEMRRSLLRDSMDPDIRPVLAARCNALARSLRQALHGRPCEATSTSTRTDSGG